jgi:hypothetical protein
MKDTLKAGDEWFRAAADASLDSLFVAKGVRDEAGQLVDFECIDANGTSAGHRFTAGGRVCD